MADSVGLRAVHNSAVSRTIHWLTVLLMAGMFYTGFTGFGGGPPPGAGRPPGGPPGTMMMRPGPGGPTTALGGPPRPPPGMPAETPFGKIPLHKAMGFTILLLATVRILYRFADRTRFPLLPSDLPAWQVWAARGVQGLIYAMIVIQPLSGWLGSGRAFTWFGIFTMPPVTFLSRPFGSELRFIHTNGAWVLIWLICLHALGALYHHYIRKDNVLMSMIRG